MSMIKLQSNDGVVIETDINTAKCMGTIRTMMEYCDITECNVPLPNVNSTILRKVIEWSMVHYEDDTPNLAKKTDDDVNEEKHTNKLSSWDVNFLRVDQNTLFELIRAANYLDVKGLIDVTARKIAQMMEGKSPEELRRTFHIK